MKNNKKGFTLAELLIVVAIIAILIAIAIPVFGGQLDNAKLTADHANIRNAYAMIQVGNLNGELLDADGGAVAFSSGKAYFGADGSIVEDPTKAYKLKANGSDDKCTETTYFCKKGLHKKDQYITIVKDSNGFDFETVTP